jgi:metal-responsive CopG/Arc/MetJ family transcriptional regulator
MEMIVGRPKQFDTEVRTKVTDETLRDLQRFANRDNATVSDLVRAAIRNYLTNRRKKEGQT